MFVRSTLLRFYEFLNLLQIKIAQTIKMSQPATNTEQLDLERMFDIIYEHFSSETDFMKGFLDYAFRK